jgi:hypothetical protein
VKAKGLATVTVKDINNAGTIDIDPGATFNTSGNNNDANSGALQIDGAGSTFSAGPTGGIFGNLSNTGLITIFDQGSARVGAFTNGAGGQTWVSDAGMLSTDNVMNQAGGLINVVGPGSKISAALGVVNNGTINAVLGGNIDPPTIQNTGTINIDHMSSMTAASYIQSGVATLLTLDGVLNGPVTIQGGVVTGGGTSSGTLHNIAGIVRPGGFDNTLAASGDFAQDGTGELDIVINTLNSFKQLLSSGHSTVDGQLKLLLSPAYTPHLGDTFPVLLSDTGVSGAFSSLAQSINYSSGFFQAQYQPTEVDAVFVPEPASATAVLFGLLVVTRTLRARGRQNAACAMPSRFF